VADWPSLQQVIAFRDRVRARLRGIYDDLESGKMEFTQHAGRVLFMGYEHEGQHAETLLYMLAQSRDTEAPGSTPDWEVLKNTWTVDTNKVIEVQGRSITLGHDDPEGDDDKSGKDWSSHEFGWDEESPSYTIDVKSFKADALPITNNNYLEYLQGDHENIPASWIKVNDKIMIRTFYGPIEFELGKEWPLMASKLEIEGYCKAKGGRLPTEAELRVLWETEEGPRVDGENANIGFRNWHPIPLVLFLFFFLPFSFLLPAFANQPPANQGS
jgi:formylglycine-generating enzyme required for sulfatase activity